MGDIRCGLVAVIGRPNVGKSTLINQILGTKVSITSPKAQTTRHRILGIDTRENHQLVFVDTPGIHATGAKALNRIMNKAAWQSIHDVDVIVWVLEGLRWQKEDTWIADRLAELKVPVIMVLNKVDTIRDKTKLLPYLDKLQKKFPAQAMIPLSATKNDNVDALLRQLHAIIPVSTSFLFPPEMITDRSAAFRASELIREKLTLYLDQELPYELNVEIERFESKAKSIVLNALVWVEKESQKGIVIGHQGERLKKIATAARHEMEAVFGKKVHLELWVKIRRGWMNDEKQLKSWGYGDQ